MRQRRRPAEEVVEMAWGLDKAHPPERAEAAVVARQRALELQFGLHATGATDGRGGAQGRPHMTVA